jgi:hypothetical protein
MREMPTQVGSTTGNEGRAEGLPEMQESVLECAAPEANQTPRLAGRLADGDYTEMPDVVKLARKRLNHGHFIVRNLGTPQEVWAVPTVLLPPSDQAPARPS